jgi:hypothetical protein
MFDTGSVQAVDAGCVDALKLPPFEIGQEATPAASP